ncbi:unnamed protein product [Gemmata massiliana]|uniref:Uncharacterized protein n=1 Tax=Gemmata massiliana TaxID=1210884 RepID=A0A6P2CRX1_9BACT|nr:hypothetical protein [Gemmata massiliana]VTR90825.1 unnamed protein product [Gemmata massiliana]
MSAISVNKTYEGRAVLDGVRSAMRLVGAPDRVAIAPFTACGRTVHLRTLGAERQAALFMYSREHPGDVAGYLLRIIAASACDRHGNAIFTPEQAGGLSADFAAAVLDEIIARNRMDCVPAEAIA